MCARSPLSADHKNKTLPTRARATAQPRRVRSGGGASGAHVRGAVAARARLLCGAGLELRRSDSALRGEVRLVAHEHDDDIVPSLRAHVGNPVIGSGSDGGLGGSFENGGGDGSGGTSGGDGGGNGDGGGDGDGGGSLHKVHWLAMVEGAPVRGDRSADV